MIKIKSEHTPNPATICFRFSEKVLDQSFEFLSTEQSQISPLAYKLFGFPWTQSVFLSFDFISITKQDWVQWDFLEKPLQDLIETHFASFENPSEALIDDKLAKNATDTETSHSSDLVTKIKSILKSEIKPAVAYDGGDVEFHSYENRILNLIFKGACSHCPSKNKTLKNGIEVRLKQLFPEIAEVKEFQG